MEKLENKLVDMREMYNECKYRNSPIETVVSLYLIIFFNLHFILILFYFDLQ